MPRTLKKSDGKNSTSKGSNNTKSVIIYKDEKGEIKRVGQVYKFIKDGKVINTIRLVGENNESVEKYETFMNKTVKKLYHNIYSSELGIKNLLIKKDKTQSKHNKLVENQQLKSCQIRVRDDDICAAVSYIINKDKSVDYNLESLLTGSVDLSCHNLSGKNYIAIIDDYMRQQFPNQIITGSLWDGAQNYKSDICDPLKKYLKSKVIDADFFINIIDNTHKLSWARLSVLTIFKTGLAYYEKFGYMYFRYNKNKNPTKLSYADKFDKFLDNILEREKLIFSPISENTNKLVHPRFKLIKALLKALKPNEKFELKTAHDLYKIIDTDIYPFSYFLTGEGDQLKSNIIHYANLRIDIGNLLTIILEHITFAYISDDKDKLYIVKCSQIESSANNKFTLDIHRQIPGVYSEFLGSLLPGKETGRVTCKGLEQKLGKVKEFIARLKEPSKSQQLNDNL